MQLLWLLATLEDVEFVRRLIGPYTCPIMRCAELMAAVGELCADLHGRGLWDATDAEFLEAIWQFRRNYEAAAAVRSTTA